jgi:hypothetical protein
MGWTRFGAGTVTFTIAAGTPQDFSVEVKGGGVEHEYDDVGEDTTYLDGTTDPAGKQRNDSLTLDCDFDLSSATGFYNFLYTNDLADSDVQFTPNTLAGANWSGTVRLMLPDGAVADEFGAKMSGTVDLPFIGACVFAAAGA